jgi:hypothetical protein
MSTRNDVQGAGGTNQGLSADDIRFAPGRLLRDFLALRWLRGQVMSEMSGLDEFLVRNPAIASARWEHRHRTRS